MAYNVIDIAHKLLYSSLSEKYGELMSNLKLQKMLYYQQGFHLAVFGKPLYDQEIEAWMYGPVVPSVYQIFSQYQNQGIEWNGKVITLDKEEERLFIKVNEVYGQYSSYGLMLATHDEMPYKSTPIGVGNVISKEKMRIFFLSKIKWIGANELI